MTGRCPARVTGRAGSSPYWWGGAPTARDIGCRGAGSGADLEVRGDVGVVCGESQSPDRSSWPANEPTEVRFTWRVSGLIFATGAPARSMSAQGRAVEAVCRSAEHEVWVAVEGGRPVGFVAVRYGEEDAARAGEIEMVAVDPRCQRAARTTSPWPPHHRATARPRTAGHDHGVSGRGGAPGCGSAVGTGRSRVDAERWVSPAPPGSAYLAVISMTCQHGHPQQPRRDAEPFDEAHPGRGLSGRHVATPARRSGRRTRRRPRR